jgi:predicted ATPase
VAELPRGTVTFLFTDIEGSTRLIDEVGEARYEELLAQHRTMLRDAFSRYGGVEVDTQGDAFFYVFEDAAAALQAAAEAQASLARGSVAVRMGAHTGEARRGESGYVGREVHRAARIAAAAHGGQVVVSVATAEAADWDLTELGEHRLKDFDEPAALFQLGPDEFPPLKTISNTNLPRPASSFVGREREVREVVELVRANRLVTLTGPGGSGKTRLSIESAAELVGELRAGVFWVALATLRDPELVLQAVAQALGAQEDLREHVGERELLLLLDNLEQVIGAAPELAALVEACPNLRLLVTSRELLRVRGEVEYEVLPLAEPDAVELFCARAQVEPSEPVEELCRRLDNLPLALELAAARARVLTPDQILDRLAQRLDLLKGGRDADPRQATLRTTIEWSHDLLDEDEQRLFRQLACFAGGCTLEAAEEVVEADIDLLQSLVEKSLVRRTDDRFWMLETIREFAAERLEAAGEADEILHRLAVHMLALGESAGLTAESDPPERPELVRPELDNFRSSIEWSREHDPELAFRLAISLEQFWVLNDPFEGARVSKGLLDSGAVVSSKLRALALRVLSESAFIAGDREAGPRVMEESLAEFERLGDELAIAIAHHRLGVGVLVAGDIERAKELFEASLATVRRLPNAKLEGDLRLRLASIERREGNFERAAELLEQSIQLLERIGHRWLLAEALLTSSELFREGGEMSRAEERARVSLRLSAELVDRQSIVYAIAALARLAAETGQPERAGRLWGSLEVETPRAPVGMWEQEREEIEAQVVRDDPAFERGRESGRGLSLDEAVAYALGP